MDLIEYIKSARNFDNICAAGVLQFCYPKHGTYSNQKYDNISLGKYVSRAIIRINKKQQINKLIARICVDSISSYPIGVDSGRKGILDQSTSLFCAILLV